MYTRRARLRYEMSLWKCWVAGLTNEFRRGYTSRLRHGCISRSYRRLDISLSGRCSLKPRPLPSCILYISHDSRSLRPEERRHKMLSASILFQREKLRCPHSSSRVIVNTSCRISNCAPGIQIMFLNFGISRSRMLGANRQKEIIVIFEFIQMENSCGRRICTACQTLQFIVVISNVTFFSYISIGFFCHNNV